MGAVSIPPRKKVLAAYSLRPDLEEVLRRALNGDVSAYRALTYYEYRLVIALLERANRGGEVVTGRFPPEAAEMIETALRKRRNRLRATGALEALHAA
jgi:hypothetical protein